MHPDLLPTLRAKAGNIAEAAEALSISRQTIYNKIREDPALAAAVEKIRQVANKPGSVSAAIRRLTIDPEAVEARSFAAKTSLRAAARAIAIETIAERTNLSQREVSHRIARDKAMRNALNRKLPREEGDREERELFPAGLTHEQWAWLKTQGKGTAATILANIKAWPEVSPSTIAEPRQTSFLLPVSSKRALEAEAERQKVSPVQLFRAVIDAARATPKAA